MRQRDRQLGQKDTATVRIVSRIGEAFGRGLDAIFRGIGTYPHTSAEKTKKWLREKPADAGRIDWLSVSPLHCKDCSARHSGLPGQNAVPWSSGVPPFSPLISHPLLRYPSGGRQASGLALERQRARARNGWGACIRRGPRVLKLGPLWAPLASVFRRGTPAPLLQTAGFPLILPSSSGSPEARRDY